MTLYYSKPHFHYLDDQSDIEKSIFVSYDLLGTCHSICKLIPKKYMISLVSDNETLATLKWFHHSDSVNLNTATPQ